MGVDKSKKANLINWISIFILWVGLSYSIASGLANDIKVIFAIILLIIATSLTHFNYVLGVKVTLGIIIIGVFNLVDFFHIKYSIGFGINETDLGLELILLTVGVIHYFTNQSTLYTYLKSAIQVEQSEEQIKGAQRSEINSFKRRFANKGIQELEHIISNDKLLPEAKTAAKELIEEKNI